MLSSATSVRLASAYLCSLCFARSGCNEATATSEKLEYESMDLFLQTIKEMEQRVGKDLSFWKADIDSAFRRIPIRPQDREHSHIVFLYNGYAVVAKHLALMFGSVASVHHWERVGTCCGTWLRTCACCHGCVHR